MRIGFDAKRAFFNRSGLGVYSRGTIGLMARYAPENDYVLFSPRPGNTAGFDVPPRVRTVVPSGAAAAFPSLWRSLAMSGDIRRSGVDIYHGLSHELPADIRRARVRSVVTMHDLIFVHHPELYKPADRYLYTRKYRRSCDAADRIIAISRQTRDDLVDEWNIAPEKIEVVYQGCDPRFAADAPAAEKEAVRKKYGLPENYILSVGTIEERKNLMLTVKALRVLPHLRLVACGRHTPYADRIMEFAAANGLADRVTMIHDASFADLPALYRMADAFVYASFFEGFGIPILEALNSRIPVITTTGGVFSETGGDACIYIDPHSEEAMADALRRVAEDGRLREEMIAKGVAHAARFTEPSIARNLSAVYKSLL